MADLETVRRLALALPEVVEAGEGAPVAFAVDGKGIAWSYLARETPKGRRLAVDGTIAVRCSPERTERLIEAAPARFFTDDHYRGDPAVIVRLDQIDEDELAHLLYEAWRLQAPKGVQKRHTL